MFLVRFALLLGLLAGGITACSSSSPPLDAFADSRSVEALRINLGGPRVIDRNGAEWEADRFGSTGRSVSTSHDIAGTEDDEIYKTARVGYGRYEIPIAPGSYTVTLHFAEIKRSEPKRSFDIVLQGSTVVDDFDIMALVGENAASQQTFGVVVRDGKLLIELRNRSGEATVSGIEIRADAPAFCVPGKERVVGKATCFDGDSIARINSGSTVAIVDSAGRAWYEPPTDGVAPPRGVISNRTEREIANTEFDLLFQTVSNEDEFVAVPPGDYLVQIGFVELDDAAVDRRFDVQIDGKLVLEDYNIYDQVGAFTVDAHVFAVTVPEGADRFHVTLKGDDDWAPGSIGAMQVLKMPVQRSYSWRVASADDFSGSEIDRNKWSVYSGGGNEGVGVRAPGNVSVQDGELQLTGTGNHDGSGVSQKLNLTYGRFVVRARTDAGHGYGPAALVWPQSEAWKQDGELDISEIPQGDRTKSYFTVHEPGGDKQTTPLNGDFTQWHTWTMEWTYDAIAIWVDGVLLDVVRDSSAIPSVPMHLALQQDVGNGSGWITKADAQTPAAVTFHVDAVATFRQN